MNSQMTHQKNGTASIIIEAVRKNCCPSTDLEEATVGDLRHIVMHRVLDCRQCGEVRSCYFRLLKALSFTSCLNLLRGMTRPELLRILQTPCECGKTSRIQTLNYDGARVSSMC
jgi:hypothetical protein